VLAGIAEDVSCNLALVTGMSHANAQSVKTVGATKRLDNVTHAIMAAMTTTGLDARSANREIDFVVGNQNLLRCNIKILAQGGYRLTAAIHEGRGEQQTDIVAVYGDAAAKTVKTGFCPEFAAILATDRVDKPGTDIVPVVTILWAWISQTHNQFELFSAHGVLSGLSFFAFGGTATRSQNSYHSVVCVRTVLQVSAGYAFRELDLGDVDGFAHAQVSHVDFQEFRQIFRQAHNVQFRHGAQQAATASFHAFALVFVDQVHRYFHVDGVSRVNALEVSVHNARLGRVTLQC